MQQLRVVIDVKIFCVFLILDGINLMFHHKIIIESKVHHVFNEKRNVYQGKSVFS